MFDYEYVLEIIDNLILFARKRQKFLSASFTRVTFDILLNSNETQEIFVIDILLVAANDMAGTLWRGCCFVFSQLLFGSL